MALCFPLCWGLASTQHLLVLKIDYVLEVVLIIGHFVLFQQWEYIEYSL